MVRSGLSLKEFILFALANFGVVLSFQIFMQVYRRGFFLFLNETFSSTIVAMAYTFIPYLFFRYLLQKIQGRKGTSKSKKITWLLYPVFGALIAAIPSVIIMLGSIATGSSDLALFQAFILLSAFFGALAGSGYGMVYAIIVNYESLKKRLSKPSLKEMTLFALANLGYVLTIRVFGNSNTDIQPVDLNLTEYWFQELLIVVYTTSLVMLYTFVPYLFFRCLLQIVQGIENKREKIIWLLVLILGGLVGIYLLGIIIYSYHYDLL